MGAGTCSTGSASTRGFRATRRVRRAVRTSARLCRRAKTTRMPPPSLSTVMGTLGGVSTPTVTHLRHLLPRMKGMTKQEPSVLPFRGNSRPTLNFYLFRPFLLEDDIAIGMTSRMLVGAQMAAQKQVTMKTREQQ